MIGSLNIHQDEIGALLCDRCKRLLAVLGLGDLVVGGSQHIADDLPIIRLLALDPAWSVTIGITDNTPCVAPRVAAGPAPFAWTDHQTIA
jgi:hypothetical protein